MRKFLTAALAAASAAALLTACGPGADSQKAPAAGGWADAQHKPAGPVYTGTGAIASVEASTVSINQAGVADAGLAAGTTPFHAYADVLAEAPLDPGSQVSFSFQKAGDALVLTELKPG